MKQNIAFHKLSNNIKQTHKNSKKFIYTVRKKREHNIPSSKLVSEIESLSSITKQSQETNSKN